MTAEGQVLALQEKLKGLNVSSDDEGSKGAHQSYGHTLCLIFNVTNTNCSDNYAVKVWFEDRKEDTFTCSIPDTVGSLIRRLCETMGEGTNPWSHGR